jgi:hypothetical protein
MILSFLKRPLPTSFAAIVGIAALIWVKYLFFPTEYSTLAISEASPLYPLGIKFFEGSPFISRLLSFAVIVISSLYLIQLNSKYILIQYRTYLPALFFTLIASSIKPIQHFSPALISTLLVIAAIDQTFASYDKGNPLDNLFKSAFLVGVASLCFLPSAIFIILLYLSSILFRPISLRGSLTLLFGFLTPWFFLFVYFYLLKDNLSYIPDALVLFWNLNFEVTKIDVSIQVFFIYLALLVLVSGLQLLSSFPNQKIVNRKFNGVFLWFIAISISLVFFVPWGTFEIIYLVAIPISFLLSHFFTFIKNRFWGELLFSLLLFITAFLQFF